MGASTSSGRRPLLRTLVIGWAVLGAAVGIDAMVRATPDARLLMGVLAAVGPASAAWTGVLLRRGQERWAGSLLVISVVTPTAFAWPCNLAALVAGIVLVLRPRQTDASPAPGAAVT